MNESRRKPGIVLFAGRTRRNPGASISLQAPGSSQILWVLSTLPVTAEATEVTGPHPPPPSRQAGPCRAGHVASHLVPAASGRVPMPARAASGGGGCRERGAIRTSGQEMKEPLVLGDERAGRATVWGEDGR